MAKFAYFSLRISFSLLLAFILCIFLYLFSLSMYLFLSHSAKQFTNTIFLFHPNHQNTSSILYVSVSLLPLLSACVFFRLSFFPSMCFGQSVRQFTNQTLSIFELFWTWLSLCLPSFYLAWHCFFVSFSESVNRITNLILSIFLLFPTGPVSLSSC